jgi:hypothetical protein
VVELLEPVVLLPCPPVVVELNGPVVVELNPPVVVFPWPAKVLLIQHVERV